jgi:DNA-binding NarL/FixJ family response regulator
VKLRGTLSGDLSPRQRQVLDLLCSGLERQEILRRMRIAKATYDYHRQNLLQKAGAQNNVQLGIWAQKQGLAG